MPTPPRWSTPPRTPPRLEASTSRSPTRETLPQLHKRRQDTVLTEWHPPVRSTSSPDIFIVWSSQSHNTNEEADSVESASASSRKPSFWERLVFPVTTEPLWSDPYPNGEDDEEDITDSEDDDVRLSKRYNGRYRRRTPTQMARSSTNAPTPPRWPTPPRTPPRTLATQSSSRERLPPVDRGRERKEDLASRYIERSRYGSPSTSAFHHSASSSEISIVRNT
jgi:hypothetical protein